MARIRGLICGHIGMIELVKALLVSLDLGFARKPQHFHNFHTLYLIAYIYFTCFLFVASLLSTQTLSPLHFTHCHICTHSTLSTSCHLHLARALSHTHHQGIGEPMILRWNDNPLHNLLTPYFDGSSNGAAAGDLGLIFDFLVVLVETLAFFCFFV